MSTIEQSELPTAANTSAKRGQKHPPTDPTEHSPLRDTMEVCRRVRCSRVTLWRLVRDKHFPEPIRIASRPFWLDSDVEKFLSELIAARGTPA